RGGRPTRVAARVSECRILPGVRARWILLATLVLCAPGAALWIRAESQRERVRTLTRKPPGLSQSTARHLALDGDAAFRRFGTGTGVLELRESYFALGSAIDTGS